MWSLIPILPLLLGLTSCLTHANNASKSKTAELASTAPGGDAEFEFIKKFGLKEGKYELQENTSKGDCIQGLLEVLEIEDNKFTVMIGGQQLLSGISGNKETQRVSRDNCVTSITITPEDRKIKKASQTKCPIEKKNFSDELTVIFSRDEIKYQSWFKDSTGKVMKEASCHLRL